MGIAKNNNAQVLSIMALLLLDRLDGENYLLWTILKFADK